MGKLAPHGNSPRRKDLPVRILLDEFTKKPLGDVTIVSLPDGTQTPAHSAAGQQELRRRAFLRRLSKARP
jgi:hypothetical protein